MRRALLSLIALLVLAGWGPPTGLPAGADGAYNFTVVNDLTVDGATNLGSAVLTGLTCNGDGTVTGDLTLSAGDRERTPLNSTH